MGTVGHLLDLDDGSRGAQGVVLPMCGIRGFVVGASPEAPRVMRQTMSHRSPDDAGDFCDEVRHIGLGHTRLSLIDRFPSGRQPCKTRTEVCGLFPMGRFMDSELFARILRGKAMNSFPDPQTSRKGDPRIGAEADGLCRRKDPCPAHSI